MNLTNLLALVGLAALPIAATALDDGSAQEAAKQAAPRQDATTLVQRLGEKDYKARKEAFRALEKMGASARGELEKALKSDDPEVRWSASLLLDRLDEAEADGALGGLRERDDDAPPGLRPPLARGRRQLRTQDDVMQEMREQMRRLEEWQKQFQEQNPGWFHGSPFGLRLFDDPFRGFDEFDDFGGFGGLGRDGGLRLVPGSSFSRSSNQNGVRESLSIQVDEKGHVTAEQEKDGKSSKFEADSVEALRNEHPELFDGVFGGRGGMSIEVRPPATAPRLERPGARGGQVKVEPAPADRPRLGVQVEPVNPDVAAYLELEEGVGLEVVRVIAGGAAEKLGVKVRDIITEVNGREIKSVDDVMKALDGKDPASAEVTVIRRGAEKTLDHAKK